jgi:CheY-like chemotaxis protein/HPt (histidine-containing phosphotransfer) domain-containing protein
VRVSVADTGIGIPPKTLPLIFKAFTQADGSTTRKYGGTGLGLAISKQLVEIMKGKIGVESTVGSGSTFWFELPFSKQKQNNDAPEALPDFHKLRVLVVDDNATNRGTLQHQLERWRIRSGVATDATESLTALRAAAAENDPYSIVLIDMQMPGMDGMTLAKAIRSEPALASARVLILTPFGQRLDPDLMDEMGVSQCLIKPLKQSRLLDALVNTTHMALAKVPESVVRPSAPAAGAKRAIQSLRILLAEDNAVNQKLALRQLQKLGYSAHAVGNGIEVLQEVERFAYDVILMDCQMPEMDGYEVTERIREFEQKNPGRRSPAYIIAVTAHALEGDRERCLSAGMNDYLTKPLHIAQLDAALSRAIRRRPPAEHTQVTLDPMCIAGLKELREPGQADPLVELAELFNREADACIQKMERGLAERDSKLASRSAHSLKGSASNLGAQGLATICAALEYKATHGEWTLMAAQLDELKAELARVRESLRAEIQPG